MEELAELCERVESVSGRNRKVEFIAEFLGSIDREEIEPTVLLLMGRPLPETDSRKLDVGPTIIGRIQEDGKQSTLFDESVQLVDVLPMLSRIADATGPGSRRLKENLLRNLLGRLSPRGRKYLRRSLYREMRIGASEGVMLEAIARASGNEAEVVKEANMLLGDLGKLAEMAMDGDDLHISARIFIPVRPMLAETVDSVEEALRMMGMASLEFKLDGVRVQIHRRGEEVRIFSRRLTEVTDSLPEIVELARELSPHNFIVDGEVIAFRDRPLPFQDLMRRFRRVGEMKEIRRIVPVRLFLFDILMREGEELMDLPYGERYDLLSAMVPTEMLAPRIVTSSTEEGMAFFERSLREGHEGLMAKDMESPYITGKGGRRWLKIKRSHNLDLIIVAAEWGHGRRRGWLSDYYLAAVDGDGYSIVGKTFKGLTDEEFEWMTSRLLDLKIDEEDHVMRVEPQVVVEVAFDEIQTSSRYPSGMTLRFARIKAIREDKDPVEADPIEEVEKIYEAQFLSRDRLNGKTDREGSKQ